MTSRHLPTSRNPITANLVLNLLKIKYNPEREGTINKFLSVLHIEKDINCKYKINTVGGEIFKSKDHKVFQYKVQTVNFLHS